MNETAVKNKGHKATEMIDEETGEIIPVDDHGTSIAKVDASQLELAFDEGDLPDVSSLSEMKEGKSQIAKYRTQEDWHDLKDKPVRCFYMGIKNILNDKGEEINAAVFVEENGIFLASQKLILDAVRYLRSRTPLIITFIGKKKNKSGEGATNMFDVKTLVQS